MFGTLGNDLRFKPLQRGAMGFQQASEIVIEDMPVARFDFGGESQRGWVRSTMSGKGCEWVQDWAALQAVEDLPKAQIRRLDLALTTWNNEINHERVKQAHSDGRFCAGGRPPNLRQQLNSDPLKGLTCYVGNRASSKFFRAYEKGFEMVGKARNLPGRVTHVDGHAIENIYRCEVEFKAVDVDIGWDVVERRDEYFAGSYPFCAEVLPGIDADILQRRPQRAAQIDLAIALENCRIQYGPTLFTALAAYQGDMTGVWDKIIGKKHNQALIEAGVLLVDHD